MSALAPLEAFARRWRAAASPESLDQRSPICACATCAALIDEAPTTRHRVVPTRVLVRLHWKGFHGGDRARREIAAFFAGLRAQATPLCAEARA